MSVVLGIGSSREASAALFVDGSLAAAIAEERMSRVKCDGERLPRPAIDEVLRRAGFDVKKAWQSRIPTVVQVDGTARPQLVRKDRNPLYWALIDRYRQLAGIPLVLNTSFNVHEEPIVCGPSDAVPALVDNRVDGLAIGPFWPIA